MGDRQWLSKTVLPLLLTVTAAGLLPGIQTVATQEIYILASGDNRGRVNPCVSCGEAIPLGGLARRATAIEDHRRVQPNTLLLDAGDFLFGGLQTQDSVEAITEAYAFMNYDAVNLSCYDFRSGRDHTMTAINRAGLTAISANLRDQTTGELLLAPYTVKRFNQVNLGIIGVTEAPRALQLLPHLRQQLEGIEVGSVQQALAEQLPELHSRADRVVLLYSGSSRTLMQIVEQFGDRIDVIATAGLRPDQWTQNANLPPVLIPAVNGQGLARARMTADQPAAVIEPLLLGPRYEENRPLSRLIAGILPAEEEISFDAPALFSAARPDTMPESPAVDRLYRLQGRFGNRGASVTLTGAGIFEKFGEITASAGHRLLVVRSRWENIIPLTVIEQQALATEYRIPNLKNHLYLLVNGRQLAVLRPDADQLPGHLPTRPFQLEHLGSRREGYVFFELPVTDIDSLELRFYDYAHGHAAFTLLEPSEKQIPDPPLLPPAGNEIIEAAIYEMRIERSMEDREAPDGMTFVELDLRARSMFSFPADATAFDPHAEPGETIAIGTVADWLEAIRYSHLVVDGEYAYRPEYDLTSLSPDPRFLPDIMTGGRMVFLIPENYRSLVFRGDFPNARLPGGEVIRPRPIHVNLHGEPVKPPERESVWNVRDDTLRISLTGQIENTQFAGTRAEAGQWFLILDITVYNHGDKPEFFQTSQQLQYVDRHGRQSPPHPVAFSGIYRPAEHVWVPDGEQRSFQVAYLVNHEESRPRLAFRGFTMAEIIELEPPKATVAGTGHDSLIEETKPGERVDLAEHQTTPTIETPKRTDEEEDQELALMIDPDPAGETALTDPHASDQTDILEEDKLTGIARMQVIPEETMETWMRRQNRDGVNLAMGAVGARMSTEVQIPPDRVLELHNGRMTSRPRRLTPGIYHLHLAGTEKANIRQIALAATRWDKNLKLTIEATSEQGGYVLIASLQGIEKNIPHLRIFEFDSITTDEIRITAEDTTARGRLAMSFYDIMALEGPLADKSESVLSAGGMNISRLDYGGSVFYTADTGVNAAHLLTPPAERDYFRRQWRLRSELQWTEPIIIAFQANREALIASVELWPADHEERRHRLPEAIRLSASLEHPFEGYNEIGEFNVATDDVPWRLNLTEPVPARFLQVQFKKQNDLLETCIGEMIIREGTGPGYQSVLIRGDGVAWRMREQPTLTALMGEEAALSQRIEPSFLIDNIIDAELNKWVGSTIDRPGQRHVYRVEIDYDKQNEVPELDIHMAPFLRANVRLLGSSGQPVEIPEPERKGGTSLRYLLDLAPGEYLVEVASAPIYLFMGFDTSGSMGQALPITRNSLPVLLVELPDGVHIALGSSLRNRETGKHVTIFSPYSKNSEALIKANEELFDVGGGGSDWYNFLRDMLEWADENMPADAIGAKVLVADGVGSGDYSTMWDRLHITKQRLYTVGWGSQTLRLDHFDRNTGWTAARGLFNAAWYCNGRYFEPQADHELVATYEEILRDVETPADYALRINVRQRQPGRLVTLQPSTRQSRPILFVLDASGSMMIELEGRTRMAVAQDVIEQLVNSLPEDARVGLRVYGHRYRAHGAERDQAAVDSELLIPISPLDRRAFIRTVRELNARGATPLAHTIEQIPRDLRGVSDPLVIVLTDGVESFRRDPVRKSRTLRESQPDMEYVVVGFMIDQMVDRENLRGMAEAGRGVYYNAMDSDSLVYSLEQAVNPTIQYKLIDWQDNEVAAGIFGDSHELSEGEYRLYATVLDGQMMMPVTIRSGRTRQLTENDLPAAKPVETEIVEETKKEESPPSPVGRFCTQCGQRLDDKVRFCTGCGSPVQ